LGAAIPPLFLCVVGAAICCRCGYMLWVRLYVVGAAICCGCGYMLWVRLYVVGAAIWKGRGRSPALPEREPTGDTGSRPVNS